MDTVQYGQYNVPDAKDMLNLGCGQPGKEYLELANNLYSEAIQTPMPLDLLQYGVQSGHKHFKQMIIKMHNYFTNDCTIKEDDIYLTNGVSQAMLLLTSIFHSHSTLAFTEDPTYFLMIGVFKNCDYTVNTFNLDDNIEETIPTTLDNMLKVPNSLNWLMGRKRKVLLYIIPFHQNPTGKNITSKQIDMLVNLCNKYHNIIILSDETYQYLGFEDQKNSPKSLSTYHENIISMGTMSKIFFPSIRVGFIYTKNKNLIESLNLSGFMDSGGSVNAIPAYHIAMINNQKFYRNITTIASSLQQKYKILEKALNKYPSVFTFKPPTGGYFIWVKSNLCTAQQLLDIAVEYGVRFHAGTKFSPNGTNPEYFRLSFSYYSKEELELYFESRLELVVKQVKKLYAPTVFLNGATGRLGSLVYQELVNTTEYNVVCLTKNYDNLDSSSPDKSIIVDITSVDGTMSLIYKLINENINIPVIIGTTGHTDEMIKYINSGNLNITWCPNFSIGIESVVNMLNHMNTEQKYWTTMNLIDDHHVNKKDSPSGTAKRLLSCISEVATTNTITSIREGNTVGTHTLNFDSANETIIITHIAKDRKLFAVGCVRKIINHFNK